MDNGSLRLEDILGSSELVSEMKTNSNSVFREFITENILKDLIDYCIKMPENDTLLEGHKYPYNACELLCSDAGINLNKLLRTKMEEKKEEEKEEDKKEEDKKEEDKKEEDIKEEEKKEEKKEDEKKEEEKKEEEKKENDSKTDEIGDEQEKEEEEILNYPLMNKVLDYLFGFLDEEPSDDNFVLMGYFGKIVAYLLSDADKSDTIMKYIIETNPNVYNKMINHIDRKAIGSIIESFIQSIRNFFALSPEVGKICWMQFFTWIGNMCMMIYFTQYAVHTVYGVPDLSGVIDSVKSSYDSAVFAGTNFSSICFAVFNLVCFLVAIPIGIVAGKFGNKKVHIISMLSMAIAFLGMAFTKNTIAVAALMGISGIGWASICALPFAMLSGYIKPGTEGSVMGIFNIFIAGPQVFVCTLVSWFINKCVFEVQGIGVNYHWEYTFIIGAICLIIASVITSKIKE